MRKFVLALVLSGLLGVAAALIIQEISKIHLKRADEKLEVNDGIGQELAYRGFLPCKIHKMDPPAVLQIIIYDTHIEDHYCLQCYNELLKKTVTMLERREAK